MKRFFFICLLLLTLIPCAPAVAYAAEKEASDTSGVNVSEVIFSHIGDSYEWHMWTWKGHPVAIYLPVILYSKTSGWHVFSSKHIAEGETYEGFRIQTDALKYSSKLVEVAPDGSVTGSGRFNGARLLQDRELSLQYTVTDPDGGRTEVSETLHFRNRIRDGVNEWQDEHPEHYQ